MGKRSECMSYSICRSIVEMEMGADSRGLAPFFVFTGSLLPGSEH